VVHWLRTLDIEGVAFTNGYEQAVLEEYEMTGEPNYAKQNLSQFHFIHTNPTWTGLESNPGFRSQNLAINQLQHGTSVCLINDCDTKEVYVRGTGGAIPFSSLMDGSEGLDSRSDSLNPSNSSPGIRLNEG